MEYNDYKTDYYINHTPNTVKIYRFAYKNLATTFIHRSIMSQIRHNGDWYSRAFQKDEVNQNTVEAAVLIVH